MQTGERVMEIRVLRRHGMSIRGIAAHLGISRNTVRKYLREKGEPCYGPRGPAPSKLDAFKEYLRERVRSASPHRLPSTAMIKEIQQLGYTGGLTILREYLHSLCVAAVPEPLIRFETKPGEQMQVDFCIVRSGRDRLSAFVAVMGFSRAAFVRFVSNERLETLLACHEDAFAHFGGVPRKVLYDNMKTVVIERDGHGPGLHRFQSRFRDFADHHGFLPKLCQPYRAKTKGKVERFIHYLKYSFVHPLGSRLRQAGLKLDAFTANAEVGIWLRDTANTRIHATTGLPPVELMIQERPYLAELTPWRAELPPATAIALPTDDLRPLQRGLAVYEALSCPAHPEARQ